MHVWEYLVALARQGAVPSSPYSRVADHAPPISVLPLIFDPSTVPENVNPCGPFGTLRLKETFLPSTEPVTDMVPKISASYVPVSHRNNGDGVSVWRLFHRGPIVEQRPTPSDFVRRASDSRISGTALLDRIF